MSIMILLIVVMMMMTTTTMVMDVRVGETCRRRKKSRRNDHDHEYKQRGVGWWGPRRAGLGWVSRDRVSGQHAGGGFCVRMSERAR
jgi:hypothetical protein